MTRARARSKAFRRHGAPTMSHEFPTDGVELTHILVTADLDGARDFYRDLAPRVSKRIRWLVDELAAEEQRHYDLFTELNGRGDLTEQIQARIASLSEERDRYLAEQRQAQSEQEGATLDQAVVKALEEQAVKKGYRME